MADDIEIFRPGTHVAMSGERLEFSAAVVAAIAAAYDPGVHEAPLVVGHPTTDAPAYGWIERLAVRPDGVLTGTPRQVDPAFADLVAAGRYKRISASLYRPDAPNHPKPGTWYLRHVGVLGAAAPAVTGLKPIAFAGDQAGIVTLEFAAPQPQESTVADKDLAAREAALQDQERQLRELQSKLDQERRAVEQRAAAFAAAETQARRAEDDKILEGLIARGIVLPAEKSEAAALFAALDTGTLEFATPAGGTAKKPARASLAELLGRMPKRVEFGELAADRGDDGAEVAFAAPEGYAVDPAQLDLHRRAVAWQRSHPGTAYLDAVQAVSGARS